MNFGLTLFCFVLTYAGLALGRLPWLRTDRAGIALIGATLILAIGLLRFEDAIKSIDFSTITLLLGMMILVGFLHRASFFTWLAQWVLDRVHGAARIACHDDVAFRLSVGVARQRRGLSGTDAADSSSGSVARPRPSAAPDRFGSGFQHRLGCHADGQPAKHDDRRVFGNQLSALCREAGPHRRAEFDCRLSRDCLDLPIDSATGAIFTDGKTARCPRHSGKQGQEGNASSATSVTLQESRRYADRCDSVFCRASYGHRRARRCRDHASRTNESFAKSTSASIGDYS